MIETSKYQYRLARRGKWVCPQCGKKTLVCYVNQAGEVLSPEVGKCDRVNNCCYHLPPREWFSRTGTPRPAAKTYSPTTFARANVTYIPHDLLRRSCSGAMGNNLSVFLCRMFPTEQVRRVMRHYYVGTSRLWNGSTVFYQIDTHGRVRRGKIMLYDRAGGKRVKYPTPFISSVHKAARLGGELPQQCLFGEHLLSRYPHATVALVESEKTALIMACAGMDCIALATGGCANFTPAMCEPLRGRNVVLFPDQGKLDDWVERARALRHYFNTLQVSDIMELAGIRHKYRVRRGDDIGDLLLQSKFRNDNVDLSIKEV